MSKDYWNSCYLPPRATNLPNVEIIHLLKSHWGWLILRVHGTLKVRNPYRQLQTPGGQRKQHTQDGCYPLCVPFSATYENLL